LISNSQARVEYASILHAFLARQQLNGKFIKGANVTTIVEWEMAEGETYLN